MSNYDKLKAIIDEIDVLIQSHVTSSDPNFVTWETKTERLLKKIYGENSDEYSHFLNTYFVPMVCTLDTSDYDYIVACADGLKSTKAVFTAYLFDMEDEMVGSKMKDNLTNNTIDFSKVFIVHGHDEALKQSVARLIEKQGIGAIILNEQANGGKTIIEKFEEYSDVGAAICLFTSDDEGKENNGKNLNPRARQNVVFEAGYFMGKLGREKTIILAQNGVELPSDMQGIVYTDRENWKFKTLKELKAIGYEIDYERLE